MSPRSTSPEAGFRPAPSSRHHRRVADGDVAVGTNDSGSSPIGGTARPRHCRPSMNDRAAAWSNDGAATASGGPHLDQVCGRSLAGLQAENSGGSGIEGRSRTGTKCQSAQANAGDAQPDQSSAGLISSTHIERTFHSRHCQALPLRCRFRRQQQNVSAPLPHSRIVSRDAQPSRAPPVNGCVHTDAVVATLIQIVAAVMCSLCQSE
jgi:hypothetical protein